MARYDFRCEECGEVFEMEVPIGETDRARICPKGHSAVQRILTPPAIVFKGSGWYSTDHRKRLESESDR